MKKWSDKSAFEKTSDIISEVAFCVWLILEAIGRNGGPKWTGLASYIAIIVVCLFQCFSFWKVKRFISYIAIGGMICLIATFVLEFMLLAK